MVLDGTVIGEPIENNEAKQWTDRLKKELGR